MSTVVHLDLDAAWDNNVLSLPDRYLRAWGPRLRYLAPPAIVEAPVPQRQRRTVETLEDHHCRWPIGDPQHADFHFCGAKKLTGLPYCECHARRAYNTAQPTEKATPRRSPITGSFVGLHRTLLEDA